MHLTERKITILQAIINDYIASAEPVGSRTLEKKHKLGISSATIRNEMSDLEELGFIFQPHASSGRIPSDKGYRLYVDKLMRHQELTADKTSLLLDIIVNNIKDVDFLMMETAKILSVLTNYTTIATEPVSQKTLIKQIKVLSLESKTVMIFAVDKNNEVQKTVFTLQNELGEDSLNKISNILNKNLRNKILEELLEDDMTALISSLQSFEEFIDPVLTLLHSLIKSQKSSHFHMSGVNNILSFPEFSDLGKVRSIYEVLEEKETLVKLFASGDELIDIVIGDENELAELKDLSIIKARYKIGKNSIGNVAILGPTRMDYGRVVSVLTGLVENIEKAIDIINNKHS